jgi:hypothetical protein
MADIPSRTPRLSIDSPDDDEGTLETAPSSPSSRRPLSIVEEVPALSSDGGDEDHTATPDALKETSKNPILPPSTAPLLEGAPDMRPPSALATATLSDAASTRSMPTTPTTAGVDQPVAPVSPSPVRPRPSTAEESASARDIRRSRHRSTLDVRLSCIVPHVHESSLNSPLSVAWSTGEQPLFRFHYQPRPPQGQPARGLWLKLVRSRDPTRCFAHTPFTAEALAIASPSATAPPAHATADAPCADTRRPWSLALVDHD